MNDSPIEIVTHGLILGTERFDDCVEFYHKIIGLPIWYTKEGLVCLHFGDGYLMIETGGVAENAVKKNSSNPTMLRFNVKDVRMEADKLESKGVEVDFKEFVWGTVATFCDPDGNACELKNSTDPFFS